MVKLYADEDGFEAVRALDPLVCSALARVEVPSALWRKVRLGELDRKAAVLLVDKFESDYTRDRGCEHPLYAIEVNGNVLELAAAVSEAHGLRAYDAVQLACVIQARTAEPRCRGFACFDEELRVAAAAEGFDLVP